MRWQTRNYVEDHRSIDIRRWHRDGLLKRHWFSWQWTRDGERIASINVRSENDQVRLSYRSRQYGEEWEEVDQPVTITWTDCHLGGARPWFICGVYSNGVYCGRRVAKLYAAGKLFACRHCYRLHYACQSEKPMDRHLRKAQKIRARLGGSLSTFDPLPEKPKGMHWRTYERLWDMAGTTEDMMWRETAEWMTRRFGSRF